MPELTLDQGTTIRYRDEGTGPALLFVHGALVNGRLWDPVVERLRDRFRCVVPELPLGSHELPVGPAADVSPRGLARMVLGVADALELEDVTLIGNDTGGALCQFAVVERPDRIGRLVLTSCDAFSDFPPKAFVPLFTLAKLPGVLQALMAPMAFRPLRRTPLTYGWLTRRPVPDEVVDSWVRPVVRDRAIAADLRRVLKGIEPALLLDNTPRLAEFAKPVLLAWSREDKFFKYEHAQRLAKIFPDARLAPIDDAYTFVSWDRPDALADAVAEFAAVQSAGSVAA